MLYLPQDHTHVQYFPQCTSVSGTLTGLLQRIQSSISVLYFPEEIYHTMYATENKAQFGTFILHGFIHCDSCIPRTLISDDGLRMRAENEGPE